MGESEIFERKENLNNKRFIKTTGIFVGEQ